MGRAPFVSVEQNKRGPQIYGGFAPGPGLLPQSYLTRQARFGSKDQPSM